MTTDLERFDDCMNYRPSDRRPNHELGIWPQTRERWRAEAPDAVRGFTWDWFYGEPGIKLDWRDYIPMDYGFIPPYERQVLEETPEYEVVRNEKGIVTKALKEGTVDGGRMCMDTYLEFPIRTPEDLPAVKKRLVPALPARYPEDLDQRIARWVKRDYPLVLGRNCDANGFYWRARELMGTEALSFAWYDYPQMMHEMMAMYAELIIETSRPVLEKLRQAGTRIDYFVLNEDMSMNAGPLLSPQTYRTFIFPHLRRMVDFFRSCGCKYFAVDTDGYPLPLVPLLMDAGVDTLWPLERASDVNPVEVRKRFGRSLRLWGGVDKRVLALGPQAIRAHLREMIPLIEEGGFIPTVDHTVPPDISWDNFRYYMEAKMALLAGEFGKLE